MKFLHLSDLHNDFGIIKTVQQKFPNHYIIITGDITDNGTADEYELALSKLAPLIGKVFICPGNHDFGSAGNFYSRKKANRFDTILAEPLKQHGFFAGYNIPVVNDIDNVRLIALDTNLETSNFFDFACGEVGKTQLNELSNILDRSDDKIKILFFHHHPFGHFDPFLELIDAVDLARVVYNRVDLILFGHKHKMRYWNRRWGAKIISSGKSPNEPTAYEIDIEDSIINVGSTRIRNDT